MPTPHFHRFDSEGQPYFVTAVVRGRRPIFADNAVAELFIAVLFKNRNRYGFQLLCFAVMPDHVHLLVLPDKRNTISDVMRFIKGSFARAVNERSGRNGSIWQPSFYERVIRSETALHEVIQYIEANPVAANLCAEPKEYPFGSASGRYQTDLARFLGDGA